MIVIKSKILFFKAFLFFIQKLYMNAINILLVLKLSKSDILNNLEVTQTIFMVLYGYIFIV